MSHPKNSQGKYFELKEFVFSNFRKAIQHLNEPCEWIMGPFLEALSKVHGSQAAIDELTTYLSQYPSHLPARYLAYNFFKHEIPQSEDSQIEELEKIAEISPDDHLVFTLVKMLINRVDDWPFDTSDLHRWSDTQGKSVLKILPGVKNCRSLFKSELQRDTILNCVKIMMNMVEYQEWRWKEQPWIHLCHLLRRIYLTCKE
ncbi:hypothetical protein SK128_022622 [Halocaridina rubra]|uniref:Uncharacterized protein n=1 Tax=Halocaridina rubra TaxID=373956 RepID=A0AAN8WTB3_HALRR